MTDQQLPRHKIVTYLKRIGVAGFLFFLLKGLVWLYVFYFVGSKL